MPFIPDENKRTGTMRIRLAPDMLERFEVLAKRYGMPPSTLAAFAIARFVQSEELNRTLAMDATRHQVKTLGDQLGDQFNDERMERIFGPMFEGMFAAVQRSRIAEEGGRDDGTPKPKG